LPIDDDVLETIKAAAVNRRLPLRTVTNEALRTGLNAMSAPVDAVPYQTKPHRLGLKTGRNLDNIQDVLTQIEAEDSR
jgi:hypothetical protein